MRESGLIACVDVEELAKRRSESLSNVLDIKVSYRAVRFLSSAKDAPIGTSENKVIVGNRSAMNIYCYGTSSMFKVFFRYSILRLVTVPLKT